MTIHQEYFGHSRPGQPIDSWEPLRRHLAWVSVGQSHRLEGCRDFSRVFGASEWGRLAGLWHDVGKYAGAFQEYIREPKRNGVQGPDHSTAGALLAAETISLSKRRGYAEGLMLAYAIAGHHAGLPDWADPDGGQSGLAARLKKDAPEIRDALERMPKDIRDQSHPGTPSPLATLTPEERDIGLRVAIFVRMLFSCLVDADYLATESFLESNRAAARAPVPLDADQLLVTLHAELRSLSSRAMEPKVQAHRSALLRACIENASLAPGLFSITAPTGSGKTLSSLAFALEHARQHGMRRVIYALPFTSVTEQTADTLRRVFRDLGDGVVLEHHSAASWRTEAGSEPKTTRARLAAENWDAPIIVTTSVQLLESLFAARTSTCRKIHRIAQSIIILDEAQALPVHLLRPTLTALDELARGYGASIVLCSATMPAFTYREGFTIGLKSVREIVPDSEAMTEAMKRVTIHKAGHWDDKKLAYEIIKRPRVLAIVNRKRHAAEVFRAVRDRIGKHVFHLSASMCSAHRSDVLKRVKSMLSNDQPCRVVSTQVVEAGVDIDFPVVLRAMAGIDSIAQAAGRCNREGRLDAGEVVVFETDWKPAPMVARQADTAREVSKLYDDPLSLDAMEHYFRLHYWSQQPNWDKHGISEMFDWKDYVFQFRQAASKYRVIEEQTTPILVPYGKAGKELVDEILNSPELDRGLFRKSQRFTVNVYDRQLVSLLSSAACELIHDSIYVLIDPDLYDEDIGLHIDARKGNPECFIV